MRNQDSTSDFVKTTPKPTPSRRYRTSAPLVWAGLCGGWFASVASGSVDLGSVDLGFVNLGSVNIRRSSKQQRQDEMGRNQSTREETNDRNQ